MKKLLLISGISIVLAGALFTAWFFRQTGELENPGNNEAPVNLSAGASPNLGSNFQFPNFIPKPPKEEAQSPALSGVNKYTGQALDFLGDPKIVATYPKNFVDQKRDQLADVIKLIAADPKDEVNWMDVGLVKKNFDNFIGVRDVWEYAKLLNPNSALAYYNLGNLYAGYLRDNQKAEANFLQAVRLSPADSYMYLSLAEFYRDFYKEKYAQQESVLLDGLNMATDESNLVLHLAEYYKSIKNNARAIEYFKRFLVLPGVTSLQAQQIKDEMGRL